MSAEKSAENALLLLDPADILARPDDNSRFGLKPLRVESLKNSILELGEVTTPVEVEERDKKDITKETPQHYLMTAGFYRHRAAAELNAEKNAGVLLPAIVKNTGDATTRLKRQLTENMERENQSPMDKAIAMKRLMDAGVSRGEIRRIFASPGGKKGATLQPLSNASLNIHLNMLELPKTIQEKIHLGLVGVKAAYELGKVPADKRADVLKRAEEEMERQTEIEEKDEEKFLAQEKKLTTVTEEATAAKSEMQAAEDAIGETAGLLLVKTETLRAIQRAPLGDGRGFLELSDAEKKTATEKVKAAEADVKAAEKLSKDAAKKVDALKGKVKKAETLADQVKKKLEDARNPKRKGSAGKKKGGSVSDADIRKAAAGTEGAQPVKLNANEMRQVIDELASGEHAIPKVANIGKIIKEAFDGITTPKQMVAKLYEHMGLAAPKK